MHINTNRAQENANTNRSKKISVSWGFVAAGLLLFMTVLPSVFLLVRIAVGLVMIFIATVAMKITLKTMLSAILEEDKSAPQKTQSRIINLTIGLASIFVGGLSLIIIAKAGLIPACAAFIALVSYEYLKNEEISENETIGEYVNNRFDEVADVSTKFIISKIEKFLPSKSKEEDASRPQSPEDESWEVPRFT